MKKERLKFSQLSESRASLNRRSSKSAKNRIYVGDRIRIINPVFVDRVGYPLTPKIVYNELNTPENRQRVIDMLTEFDVPVHHTRFSPFQDNTPPVMVERVLREVAYQTVKVRHWGGSERTLHRINRPELKDTIHEVHDKKVVKTGTRIGPSGWGDDYIPGYLSDEKTHLLYAIITNGVWEYPLWIEKENVELIPNPFHQTL